MMLGIEKEQALQDHKKKAELLSELKAAAEVERAVSLNFTLCMLFDLAHRDVRRRKLWRKKRIEGYYRLIPIRQN